MQQKTEPKMPDVEAGNCFVPTLNKKGYMTVTVDRFMQAFIDFSAGAEKPVLDIGAAYGVAAIPALQAGAQLIANDIDPRHLAIIEQKTPRELRLNLSKSTASFPDEMNFEANSLGAVLLARVAHFLDGETLERGAAKLFYWLTPGGKVFLTAETPYLSNWSSFLPMYEAAKAAGEKWPGYIDDVQRHAPERGRNLPKTMHHLDPDVLSRVFAEAGFEIEVAEFFARPEFPQDLQMDGRESVGLIARRP